MLKKACLADISQYHAHLHAGSSWWDMYRVLPSSGGLGSAWTITYDDVEPPSVDANSTLLERTVVTYAELVRGSRDELRLVEPGMMLGQVFRRPNSYLNPTPIPFDSGIRFALFQTCDRRGNFASGGNERDLRAQTHA